MKALEIKNLKKTYKTPKGTTEALKGVSFSIEQGEFFGLLGPNGAGKSTMIGILSGIVEKTEGTATIAGIDISEDHALAKRKIGVVPQEITFDPFFTVETAMRFQFGYFGLQVDEEYLTEILTKLSLNDKRTTKPRMLSGGMKRRFMIAKALVHKPEILVLDEPTAGVDVELRHDLYKLVRELNADGITIILTSHYLEEVELLCDRVAIIGKGELIALDHKDALKNRFSTARQFVLALTEEPKKLPKALEQFKPALNGTELTLEFEEKDYQEVLAAVAKASLPIANFKIVEPSLEDVFVSLTHQE
jgi:ABC-2 type transport system ATP-binding protein